MSMALLFADDIWAVPKTKRLPQRVSPPVLARISMLIGAKASLTFVEDGRKGSINKGLRRGGAFGKVLYTTTVRVYYRGSEPLGRNQFVGAWGIEEESRCQVLPV